VARLAGSEREQREWLRLALGDPWGCPVLLGLLLDGHPRGETAKQLIDAAVSALGEAVGSQSPRVRRAAARALRHGNIPKRAASRALDRWLTDPRRPVRRAAASAAGMGHSTDDLAVIDHLLLDPTLFFHAVDATAGLIPRFVSLLMRILAAARRKPSSKQRAGGATDAWRRLGHAFAHLPQLRERTLELLARHQRPPTADELRVLRGTTDGCGPAIEVYRRALASPDEAASTQACMALLALKQIVDMPIDEHRALLESPLAHVRANTISCASILRTDPPATWKVFLRGFRDRSPLVRSAAAETLPKRFRQVPEELTSALERLMRKDRNGSVRISAAHALAHLGPERDAAVAALKAGATSRHKPTREKARRALACLGS
jgi:HEAT repeat protein